MLRDGRSLFGYLRSIDQFGMYRDLTDKSFQPKTLDLHILTSSFTANLVLHLTVERIYIGNEYGEIDRGVFLIRGENVVLCGEIVSTQPSLDNLITSTVRLIVNILTIRTMTTMGISRVIPKSPSKKYWPVRLVS